MKKGPNNQNVGVGAAVDGSFSPARGALFRMDEEFIRFMLANQSVGNRSYRFFRP